MTCVYYLKKKKQVSQSYYVTLQRSDQILVTAQTVHTKPRHTDRLSECCEE